MSSNDSFSVSSLVPVVVPVIYALVTVCGLVGNLLVVVVVALNQTMRDSTNTLIINLAISDLLFVLLCVPFTAVVYATSVWPFAALWCSMVTYLQHVSAWSSVWTLTFMAFDRFLAVVFPIRAIRLRSIRNTTIACAIAWLIVLSVNSPIMFLFRTYDYVYEGENRTTCIYLGLVTQTASKFEVRLFDYGFVIGAFVLPLGLTCFLYIWMIKRLWRNPFREVDRQSQNKVRRKVSMETIRVKRRVVKMILIVTIVFAVCWFPQNLRFVIQALEYPAGFNRKSSGEGAILLSISAQMLAYTNSCMNPILYGILSENFRKGFKNVLHMMFRKQPQLYVLRKTSDRIPSSIRTNSIIATPKNSRQPSVAISFNDSLHVKTNYGTTSNLTTVASSASTEMLKEKKNSHVHFSQVIERVSQV